MKKILVEGMSDVTYEMELRNSREVAKFILDFLEYTTDKDLVIGHAGDVVVRVSFTHKDTHKRVTIHIPGGVLMPNVSRIIADKETEFIE